MNRRLRTHNRKGTSSVEFALVFPITLLFFVSQIGLMQIFLLNDTAQHAAYEGAREGLVITSTAQDAEDAVQAFASSMNVRDVTVDVEPDNFTSSTQEVTVAVSIPLNSNAWISVPFMPDNWAVESTVTLSRQSE